MTLEPTPENLRNIKVGDTLLCGVDKDEVCKWLAGSVKLCEREITINNYSYYFNEGGIFYRHVVKKRRF